jgi:hypothetical protein
MRTHLMAWARSPRHRAPDNVRTRPRSRLAPTSASAKWSRVNDEIGCVSDYSGLVAASDGQQSAANGLAEEFPVWRLSRVSETDPDLGEQHFTQGHLPVAVDACAMLCPPDFGDEQPH